MIDTRIALVTGANQGVGFQVAKQLAANGVTVYLGARNLKNGETAASEIGDGAIAIQIDVTDGASITAAAERIRAEKGRLDLLVNNAGISNTRRTSGPSDGQDGKAFMAEVMKTSKASTAPLDEVRAVWDVNVFGTLAVYQAMLPLYATASTRASSPFQAMSHPSRSTPTPPTVSRRLRTDLSRIEDRGKRDHAGDDERTGIDLHQSQSGVACIHVDEP